MTIDYVRFDRVLSRAATLAASPDIDPIVKTVYDAKLAAQSAAFRAAHQALKDAEVASQKEHGESLLALEEIDQPYRQARVVAQQFIHDLALPKTLKSLPTMTEQKNAIARLLEILDAQGEDAVWATQLTADDFGRLAPMATREITEWHAADVNLEEAVRARMAAYSAAYDAFLGFRDVVRETYLPSSIHYRRLLVRADGKLAVDDPTDEDTDEA